MQGNNLFYFSNTVERALEVLGKQELQAIM